MTRRRTKNVKRSSRPAWRSAAVAVGIIGLAVLGSFVFPPRGGPPTLNASRVVFPTATVTVDVATTPDQRRLGLAGRSSMAVDEGMLFIFPNAAPHTFWMQGMKFPLDFLWIRNGRVVDITDHVPVPDLFPETITPLAPATHVLEVNAGFADAAGIHVGDPVSFENIDAPASP